MILQIADFGVSLFGAERPHYHPIQRKDYDRAPEVILGTGFSYPVDIWSLAIMARLLSPRSKILFTDRTNHRSG